jgi:hypothetical protein
MLIEYPQNRHNKQLTAKIARINKLARLVAGLSLFNSLYSL